jgi:hypothetical protein
MPWTASDAKRHTKKADNATLAQLWADVANRALRGGASEGSAIRQANAVVARAKHGKKKGD